MVPAMRRRSDHRWLALGTAATGLGGTAAVAYWIYTLQAASNPSYWNAPGIASLAVLVLGIVLLLVGFFAPNDDDGAKQTQRGGGGSTNLQAGGDIRIDRDD
jgi:hypothetical protein